MESRNSIQNVLILLIFLVLAFPTCITHQMEIPKLLLISMDGMRYNFLDNLPDNKIPNFRYFIDNGVKAKFIRNLFPSVTFPNHMSIVSGLYPESHGIVDNSFWDPYLEDYFDMSDYRQNFESKWFDVGAEPIWVTNYKAGSARDSGIIMWPGGVAEMMSYMPRVIPAVYWNNITYDWNLRVDHIISWFQNNVGNIRPINLGLLYFPEPDDVAHAYGPDSGNTISKEVQEVIYKLDEVLGHLRSKLEEANLLHDINIIITADHGHTNIANYTRINIDEYVDRNLYRMKTGLSSIMLNIQPTEGTKSSDLYRQLVKIPHVNVYKKGSLELTELHFSKNRRIMDFIVEANDGYIMGNNETLRNFTTKGAHGYDPRKVANMHPFFIAFGPAFKKGFLAEPFDSVDIYPLMCHILDIKPAPNNGTLNNVLQILAHSTLLQSQSFLFSTNAFLVPVIFVAVIAAIYSIGAFQQGRKKKLHYSTVNRKAINSSLHGTSSLLKEDQNEEDDDEF